MKRKRKLRFSPKVRHIIRDYNDGMERAMTGGGDRYEKLQEANRVMDETLAQLRKLLRRRPW